MKWLLTTLSIFLSIQLLATKFEGIVVKINGETIKCIVLLDDIYGNKIGNEITSKRVIKAEKDGERLKFRVDELINYSIKMGSSWHTYWSVEVGEESYLFMKRITIGKLNLYTCLSFQFVGRRIVRNFVFEKRESLERLHLKMGQMKNRRKIVRFLEECELVKSKILKRSIKVEKRDHWQLIAKIYNNNC